MVDEKAALRTQRWVDEAVALGGAGARWAGRPRARSSPPTILVDTPREAQVCAKEAFAPLVVALPFADFDDAIRQVNDIVVRAPGRRLHERPRATRGAAFDELEVGGVIINDVPTYRIDNMPYGGVKDSGLGREGLRYAIEDMTEIRILVVAQPG